MAQTGCYITMIPGISQSSCHPRTEWVINSKSKSWIKISRELVVRRRKNYICGRLVGISATVGWHRHDTYCLLRGEDTRRGSHMCEGGIMMWGWYQIMMCEVVRVISWHDVRVIQWCVRDIMMWEYWEWYHDMWVISWYEGHIMMWEYIMMCECWCWGEDEDLSSLISPQPKQDPAPGRRLSGRPRLLGQHSARTREEWPAAVLLHCYTATLLHCTMGNQGEHRQIKLSDWLFIKVGS